MVPRSYIEFMITSAGAAGAMIGLLFVAISLRTDIVFGEKSSAKVKTLAGSSFTGLVNAFSLALLAIVPSTNIGVGMVMLALAASSPRGSYVRVRSERRSIGCSC